MSYSPILGRFIQRDPLGYVDGGSLYEYVRSGPIARVDPSGLTPNQEKAIDLMQLLSLIDTIADSNKCASCEEMVELLRDQYDENPSYIYTTKWGWIDTNHFYGTAQYNDTPDWMVLTGGWMVEVFQNIAADIPYLKGRGSSAWTSEDLPSNRAGLDYWDFVENACMNGTSLREATRQWFEQAGVKRAREAPDYDSLPANEQEYEEKWREKYIRNRLRKRPFWW